MPHGARPMLKRRHRAVIHAAKRFKVEPLVAPLARRRRAMIHMEPEFGSLLFRWGVSVIRSRYAATEPSLADKQETAAIMALESAVAEQAAAEAELAPAADLTSSASV